MTGSRVRRARPDLRVESLVRRAPRERQVRMALLGRQDLRVPQVPRERMVQTARQVILGRQVRAQQVRRVPRAGQVRRVLRVKPATRVLDRLVLLVRRVTPERPVLADLLVRQVLVKQEIQDQRELKVTRGLQAQRVRRVLEALVRQVPQELELLD